MFLFVDTRYLTMENAMQKGGDALQQMILEHSKRRTMARQSVDASFKKVELAVLSLAKENYQGVRDCSASFVNDHKHFTTTYNDHRQLVKTLHLDLQNFKSMQLQLEQSVMLNTISLFNTALKYIPL